MNIKKIANEIFKAPSQDDIVQRFAEHSQLIKNADGTYDCPYPFNVNIPYNLVENGKLIIKFRNVEASFNCEFVILKSLEGCPKRVESTFYCSRNFLTSLKDCPEYIGESFYCDENALTSLVGCPEYIPGKFDCSDNKLTSLVGCPEYVDGDFLCMNNAIKFTVQEVARICKVEGEIYV